jgi:hypothetical protein
MLIIATARDIRQGEELLIAHTNLNLSRKQRQKHLLESNGFTCRCPRCTAKHDQPWVDPEIDIEQLLQSINDFPKNEH